MKICFVDKIFLPFIGGAEVVIHEVAKRLVKQGHEVHVLTGLISDEPLYEEINGIKIHRIRMPVSARVESLGRPAFILYSIWHLRALIKKERFDIVVENIAPNPSFTPLIAKMQKVPCIGIIHDIPAWSKLGYSVFVSLPNAVQTSFFLKLMPYLGFIVVSHESHRKLQAITKRGKQIVVHNGVDVERMDKVNISDKFSRPTIIYIGRFSLNKRIDWLLQATAILKKRFPDVKTLIVGTGTKKLKEKLLKMQDELGLKESVEFTGEVSEAEKITLLKKSHILVLPSTTEGCPLVLIEAMACSVPVVASNVGGIPEITKKNGVLVDGKGDEFAEKIGKLLEDEKARERMGRAGRKRVEEELNWDSVTARYLEFFGSFVKK
ncbi:glycosyltransferase family 4 protein [Candidatus Micrarchaeota archaeon]|nr:glycosyltransferase family 4 protein [Candidatus Micrarchaeota archaeon]